LAYSTDGEDREVIVKAGQPAEALVVVAM